MSNHQDSDVKKVIRTHFDLFNSRDFEWNVAVASDDSEWVDVPSGRAYRGPQGFEQWMKSWLEPIPDAHVAVLHMDCTNEEAIVDFVAYGTHEGVLRTRQGIIPPTGRRIEARFREVFQIENGKISTARLYYDPRQLVGQLGLARHEDFRQSRAS